MNQLEIGEKIDYEDIKKNSLYGNNLIFLKQE